MAEASALEQRLAATYPTIHEVLAKVVWPGADGPNLLELLHRTMRYWHPDVVRRLVDELELLGRDGLWSDGEIVELLTTGVPEDHRFVDASTARPLVRALAGYSRYLLDDAGVRGTP